MKHDRRKIFSVILLVTVFLGTGIGSIAGIVGMNEEGESKSENATRMASIPNDSGLMRKNKYDAGNEEKLRFYGPVGSSSKGNDEHEKLPVATSFQPFRDYDPVEVEKLNRTLQKKARKSEKELDLKDVDASEETGIKNLVKEDTITSLQNSTGSTVDSGDSSGSSRSSTYFTLASSTYFPKAGHARITRYAGLKTIVNRNLGRITYSVQRVNDWYARFFRIYIYNDTIDENHEAFVYETVVYSSKTGTVDVSDYIRNIDSVKIVFEIYWGGSKTDGWILNYARLYEFTKVVLEHDPLTCLTPVEYLSLSGYGKVEKEFYVHDKGTGYLYYKMERVNDTHNRLYSVYLYDCNDNLLASQSGTTSSGEITNIFRIYNYISSGNHYKLVFQIYWGAYKLGWRLNYAYLTSDAGVIASDDDIRPIGDPVAGPGDKLTINYGFYLKKSFTGASIAFTLSSHHDGGASYWNFDIYITDNYNQYYHDSKQYQYKGNHNYNINIEDLPGERLYRLYIAIEHDSGYNAGWLVDDLKTLKTVAWNVIIWDLDVSIRYQADEEEYEEITDTLKASSDAIWKATNGQAVLGNITLENDVPTSVSNNSYDINIWYDEPPPNENPHVTKIGGYYSSTGYVFIPSGWRTMEVFRHELGHYLMSLYDEYTTDYHECGGADPDHDYEAYCEDQRAITPIYNIEHHDEKISIMDSGPELCDRHGHVDEAFWFCEIHQQELHNAQEYLTGLGDSCWEHFISVNSNGNHYIALWEWVYDVDEPYRYPGRNDFLPGAGGSFTVIIDV